MLHGADHAAVHSLVLLLLPLEVPLHNHMGPEGGNDVGGALWLYNVLPEQVEHARLGVLGAERRPIGSYKRRKTARHLDGYLAAILVLLI